MAERDFFYTGSPNVVQVLATVPNINFKNTGLTTLYTVPAGKTLHIIDVLLEVTAMDTPLVDGNTRVGGNDPDYDDWGNVVWGSTVPAIVGQELSFARRASVSAVNGVYVAGSVIKLNVVTAVTATTFTLTAHLIGFLI